MSEYIDGYIFKIVSHSCEHVYQLYPLFLAIPGALEYI